MQRAKFVSTQNRFLRVARLGQYSFRLAIDERVQLGIQAFDAIKVSARHLHRRNVFPADLRRDFPRRKKNRIGRHEDGGQCNATQNISERVSFVAFLRVTSCPSWLRLLNLARILRQR